MDEGGRYLKDTQAKIPQRDRTRRTAASSIEQIAASKMSEIGLGRFDSFGTPPGNERGEADPMQASATVLRMIQGLIISRTVYVAAKLAIPDLLESGPRTSAELAHLTKCRQKAQGSMDGMGFPHWEIGCEPEFRDRFATGRCFMTVSAVCGLSTTSLKTPVPKAEPPQSAAAIRWRAIARTRGSAGRSGA